jgi:hypothetical protein
MSDPESPIECDEHNKGINCGKVGPWLVEKENLLNDLALLKADNKQNK